jgi:UDP-N-acetylglucosamine--dolichyl-phosphate N-acetylglucosaminephosphotransferase
LFIPVPFLKCELHGRDICLIHGISLPFPHASFAQYIGGQLAILCMLFLGFADDVLDIKWRFKIW